MKAIIILSFALFLVISADKEQAKKFFHECSTEQGVAPDKGEYFLEHGRLADESDKKGKCMFLCVSKKKGVANDAGVIDTKAFVEDVGSSNTVTKEKVQSIADECSKRTETDPCEKLYAFSTCTYDRFKAKN